MASFEALLECPICVERFRQPKVLPCQHTFCLDCLVDIIRDAETVDCPTCRRNHAVPQSGVHGLNDNLMAVNLLDMSSDCSDCGRNQILSDCQHCYEQLCTDCRVAHKFLQSDITTLIQSLKCDSLEKSGDLDTKKVAQSLQETLNTESRIHQAFQEAAHILDMRKSEILAQVQIFAKFQKVAVDGESQNSVSDELQTELSKCRRIDGLKALKTALGSVKGALNRLDSCLDFKADLNQVFSFGELLCGGKEIVSNTEGRMTLSERMCMERTDGGAEKVGITAVDTSRIDTDHGRELERGSGYYGHTDINRFPGNIDYASKTSAPKLTIGNPALGPNVKFYPTKAMYSALDESLYCLKSDWLERDPYRRNHGLSGALIKYSLTSAEWTIFDANANDIALADSGDLLIAQDQKFVTHVIRDSRNFTRREQTLYPTCSKVVQIACRGQEIIVLDSEKCSLMEFTKEGSLIREIKRDIFGEYCLTNRSKLDVDGEGRIYVSCVRVVAKDKTRTYQNQYCEQCDYAAAATVKWEVVIFVLTWEGEHLGQIKVGAGSREAVPFSVIQGQTRSCYSYVAPQSTSYQGSRTGSLRQFMEPRSNTHTLQQKQHPKTNEENDHIIRTLDITHNSFCIDGDGYLCVTCPGKSTLDVYNPNRLHVRTIGTETTFKEPWDVSLMPDGRLVVCDPGNTRIQVI